MSNEILDARKITPAQAGILALCFFSMMLDGFDVLIIAFTAPDIAQEMAISSQQLGLVFSAALLGMALGAMLLSSIADLYGRRLVISAMLILSGLATCAVFHVESALQLIALRFIAGLGLGTMVAVLPGLGGEFSPAANRSLITSILVAGMSIGTVVGGIISAWAIPLIGWRALYLYAGAVIIFTGVLFFIVVPESIQFLLSRKKDNALAAINRTLRYIGHPSLERLPNDSAATTLESASVKALLTPTRRTVTLLAWGMFFMAFAAQYFVNIWLPKLLVESGVASSLAIQSVVILNTGAIIGTVGIGLLSRWWSLQRLLVLAFSTATLLLLVLAGIMLHAADSAIGLIWLIAFVIGFTLHGGFGNLYTVALILYPAHIRITGLGWCVGLGRGGAIISPALAGLLLGAGLAASQVVVVFAIVTLLAMLLTRKVPVKEMP
ncbi:MAG: MFS transporter [Porticoccaceae bacterium]